MNALPPLRRETPAMRLEFEARSRETSAAYERRMVERAENEADCRAEARGRRSEILAEREECALLCDQFPDNLMARHLAKLIRERA